MKKRLHAIVLSAVMAMGFNQAHAQAKLVIMPNSGEADSEYVLSEIQRLRFDAQGMHIEKKDFSVAPLWKTSAIKRIIFRNLSNGVDKVEKNTNENIQINQQGDLLFFYGIETSTLANVSLFDLSGKIILKTMVSNNQAINISNLKQGVYIVKVNNNTIKFVKQ